MEGMQDLNEEQLDILDGYIAPMRERKHEYIMKDRLSELTLLKDVRLLGPLLVSMSKAAEHTCSM